MTSMDSIKVVDSLKYTTPKGKIVYGGGGIIPDIFVPLENSHESTLQMLLDNGVINDFVFWEIEKDRGQYLQLDAATFESTYTVSQELFDNFVDYCITNGINFHYYDYELQVKCFIKANIADQLFDENMGARIKSRYDKMLNSLLN